MGDVRPFRPRRPSGSSPDATPPEAVASRDEPPLAGPRLEGELPAAERGEQALESLRYIRDTMARASSFTAVPGWGGTAMGASALVAAAIAQRETEASAWLVTWLLEAVLAVSIGVLALILKARASRSALLSGPGRKFLLGLLPPLLAGSVLTAALVRVSAYELLAGSWLLAYGTAVVTGGQSSTRVVPVMGSLLMGIGGLALLLPEGRGDVYLALGFGAVQMLFGIHIARRHGG